MKIGVSSQNFRTVTGHAGKARRFIIFETNQGQPPAETGRLDLPLDMSMHAWRGEGHHPLFDLDHLITASCGEGFIRRMLQQGITVTVSEIEDPLDAVHALLDTPVVSA